MKTFITKATTMVTRIKSTFSNKKAEGFVDSGVKILISIVIGALLLGGLYALFGDTILPTLTTKVTELFNYAGQLNPLGWRNIFFFTLKPTLEVTNV